MRLQDLVIPLGAQLSNEIDVSIIADLTTYGPGALTGTVAIELSPDGGTTWYDSGSTVAVDARTSIDPVHAELMRLSSDMAEAAERVVPVWGGDKNTP